MVFGFGAPGPSSAQKIAAAEAELELVSDTFSRLSSSCAKKCIPKDYREADLNKGESVCLDRCVNKFFETTMKVSEIMQNKANGQQQSGGGFGGFSM
ncbi:import inner membrane translocase subunit tim10 [Ascobolus immersus RN42]|uniref:Mitochondrial import inner membrane translocase subunit n=1 Tax=Ascobolus immersus RN42 TaxID=1160509 RepID=A0A3N4I3E5_ASCIM|nr:import inner membrane translocase subunit tim10 [Ascobolus immersus RN42]